MKKAKKMSKEDAFDIVKGILCEYWDPIGLYRCRADWDWEYDSYIKPIIKHLKAGRDQVWMEQLLISFVKGMGLSPEGELSLACETTAEKLVDVADLL